MNNLFKSLEMELGIWASTYVEKKASQQSIYNIP
jgi:hypothetical protein